MIRLSRKRTTVPDVQVAPAGRLNAGSVYVSKNMAAGQASQLPGGKRTVLETQNGRAELVSVAEVEGGMETEGTYLNASDVDRLTSTTQATLRLYGWRDTLGKAWSRPGIVVLATLVFGVVLALAGIWFQFAGAEPTSSGTVATRALTMLQWVEAPADRLDGQASASEVDAARRQVNRRGVIASRCLEALSGLQVPRASPPGVTCSTNPPPFYRNKDTLTWLTLVIGLITALMAILGVGAKFGFQESPT